MNNDFENEFRNVQKNVKRGIIAMAIIWIIGLLVSLGVAGVIIWAIIRIVHKLTA